MEDLGNGLYGQVRIGRLSRAVRCACIDASGWIGSNRGFHTPICVYPKSITIPYPYIVDVILVLGDAFEGERVLVNRPLTIRHPSPFFFRVQYSDLRLEAKNSQSTYLQLTYTNLYLLYKTNLN